MPKIMRRPPGMSEQRDPRAMEYFLADLHDMFRRTGSTTVDVGSIAAGGLGTVTITVDDARPDTGMTVHLGVPSALSNGLVVWGNITADDTVTVYLYNRTGGAIDPASGTYHAWVRP